MLTKLLRIAKVAKEKPMEKFTSLAHLINEPMLEFCHYQLSGNKALGVDGVTKVEYEAELQDNIKSLVGRLKRHAYHPQPVRRAYIPKPGTNKMRPLGIPAYEDKLVQMALAKILSAIYEEDFLDSSFGFRPNRGCHDALKALNRIIDRRKINYIVDADIKGFFDHVDHEWLIKFVKHRIADPNIHRLIVRFLKSGVEDNGRLNPTKEGTPQGGLISPILANVYLHYVLDLWFEKVVRKGCRGDAYMVRYTDDFVCCFQYEEEAQAFYRALITRLKRFNLDVAEDKTKIIPFGKYAEKQCKRKDNNKPPTFDFLGFTHYCSKSRKGRFRVKRKTSKKKYRASLLKCKEWLRQNRNMPANELMERLRLKLLGYYRYYGITDNITMMSNFVKEVRRMLFKWLNRRSQRKSFDWSKYVLFLERFPLPKPKIYVKIYELRTDIGYIL